MRLNLRRILLYLMTYLLIIMHGAVLWYFIIEGSTNYIVIFLTLFFIMMIFLHYKIPIKKTFFIYSICLVICYFISSFVNHIGLSRGLNIQTALLILTNILVGVLIVKLDKKYCLTVFVNISFFFCLISIFLYLLQSIIGAEGFSSLLFPEVGVRKLYGYLVYTVPHDDMRRNYGIFYEPGVYQIIINACIYLTLFYRSYLQLKDKNIKIYLAVFLLTLLTSRSTTGYISLAIIVFFYFIDKEMLNDTKKELLVAVVSVFLILGIDYILNGDTSFLVTAVIKKFKEMRILNGSYSKGSSGGARLFVIEQAILSMCENPLFGIGANRLESSIIEVWKFNLGTGNVLFTMITTKGLVTTTVCVIPIMSIAYKNRVSNGSFFCFLLMYLNTTVAQSQIWYGAFLLIAFYKIKKQSGSGMVKNENIMVYQYSNPTNF